ncbi:MAG: competence/damage-inducible protein A [Crocinitomicaceae bacterium]|nr:competence/damage-inducible protein A [Crocinitomicaceae bacterium]
MKVEIISIGDELLIGQTINTNASWMGSRLAQIGANVQFCTVVQDNVIDMTNAIDTAMNRVDVVLITGGLGPTKDDITKDVLCDYFNAKLVRNEEVLRHVELFFALRKRPMLDVNKLQADVPENCEALFNEHGTAPGMWFHKNDKVLVSMPGVPYEMKSIMSGSVLDRLTNVFDLKSLYYRTIQTQGIGESYIADRMQDLEDEITANGISLAYLPSPGSVRLRLSSEKSEDKIQKIEKYTVRISEQFKQYVFGYGNDQLQEVVGTLLREKNATLSTIESCTGGALAALIVSTPGSSSYYQGSIVSYSNEIKENIVDVKKNTIINFGVVSEEVVVEMAVNGRQKMGTDYCISLSGIAGPDGAVEGKPVGTVWIAISGPKRVITKKFQFEKNRDRNIRRSVLTALNLLRCELMEINIEKS